MLKFESIRMKDDESTFVFYIEPSENINLCFNLGEIISNSKMVKKILRSLFERFIRDLDIYKMVAIKESKNVDMLKVYELVDSSRTYKMTLPSPRRPKRVTLKPL